MNHNNEKAIQSIKNNVSNRIFFNNSKFHGDKSYKILKQGELFMVETSHGKAYYHLDGTKIGDYCPNLE